MTKTEFMKMAENLLRETWENAIAKTPEIASEENDNMTFSDFLEEVWVSMP